MVYKSGQALVVNTAGIAAVDALWPSAFGTVVEYLENARVGFARDCTFLADDFNHAGGTVRLTWYGKGGRQNSFTASSGPVRTCPPAVTALLLELRLGLPVHQTLRCSEGQVRDR